MPNRFYLAGAAAVVSVALGASSLGASAATSHAGRTFPTVPGGRQVSITLASYMPLFGTPGVNELNSLVSGFEKLHPNIHVTTEAETSPSGIAAQLQQDEVAGHTPDVAQETFNDLKFVAKDLGAVDLTKTVGTSTLDAEFGGPYRYAPAVAKLGDVAGDVYGVPWTLSTPVLFYNATLFKRAGLDPKIPPPNWAAVQADAAKIKSVTGASGLSNGCIGAAAGGSDWCLQAIIDSAGGSVLNGSQSGLTLNDPRTEFALKQMQALADTGAMVNLSATQAIQAFASGKLAMLLNTSAYTGTLVAAVAGHFQMLASRMPGFGSKIATPTNSGSALFMLSKSKLAREADWELIEYLTSPAAETTITENIGYPPLRPSIATMPQYLDKWASANQFLTANLFQLEHISPWLAYPGPNYNAITTIVTNAAAGIAFQGDNPATTMAAAQGQAAALLK